MPVGWPTGKHSAPISTLHMDQNPLDSIILLPTSSNAAIDGAAKAHWDDLTTPTLQPLESKDQVMLDILHPFGHNQQNLFEEKSQFSRQAHPLWPGESDGPPSSPRFPAQSLALQRRIRSNAPSPSPIPSNFAAATSQVHGCQAEVSHGIDIELDIQPQTFSVGVGDDSEEYLGSLSKSSIVPYPPGSNGLKPSSWERWPTIPDRMSQMAAETLTSVQGHAVVHPSVQETGLRDTVQSKLMARAQQKILSHQSEAQALSQISMRLSALLSTSLQLNRSLLFQSLQLASSLDERMTLAVNKARAAESIIWSLVQRAKSTHEIQALQQQAEDAQQLTQEMMAYQRHIHQLLGHLGAMLPQSPSSPQSTLPAPSAAAYRPQLQRQNRTRVQHISPAQPRAEARSVTLDEGPIGQVQDASEHVHPATGYTQQPLEQAVQTTRAKQKAEEILAHRQARTRHLLYNAHEQIHSQQESSQSRCISRPVAYPKQPQFQAAASPPKRAVRPGQLLTAELCVHDHFLTYLDPYSRKMLFEVHQGADASLRGGSSGDKRVPKSTAREINETVPEDVPPFPYLLDVVRAPGSDRQPSTSLNNDVVATSRQQRSLANITSLHASTTSTNRRRDSIIERLGEAQLNTVVLRNGMNPQTVTQEQKRELAQIDLNNWREEQRGRLRRAPNPIAQPSSSSVTSGQNDGQYHDNIEGHMNTATRTSETPLGPNRITSAEQKLSSSDADVAESTVSARERQMHPQLQQRSLDAAIAEESALARERHERRQAQIHAQLRALARLRQGGLFHQQIPRRNDLPGFSHPSYAGPIPYPGNGGLAVGHVLANQELSRTSYHASPHIVFSRPSSRASTSHRLFAEIVDEVTREVLAPGPGRCGITGV